MVFVSLWGRLRIMFRDYGGHIIWPERFVSSPTNAGLGANNIAFDSATDRVAWIGTSPLTDSITNVYIRTGTTTTGCTIEIRIESISNGRPSGSLIGANTNGTAVIGNGQSNLWFTVTLTSAASLTAGQQFAI